MANGEYKLVKVNASNTLDEKTIQAVSGKVLGFDSNLDPSMVDSGGSSLTIGRTIADATSNFATTDVNKLVLANRSTAQTFSLPHTTFAQNDIITVMQLGAGLVTIAVADGTKQTINAAKKTWGADSVIQIMCIDATANAEVWKVIGGIV